MIAVGLIILAFVADEIGMLGNVGIIGLYVTILVTVGGLIRNFLLPQVNSIMLGIMEMNQM